MNWKFNNIIPTTLQDFNLETSQLWGKEIEFISEKNYVVYSESGKGKTTFSNFCIGVRKDYSGELMLNKTLVNQIDLNRWSTIRSKKVAYVPQNLQLLENHTIWENLLIKNDLTKFKSNKEIYHLLEVFGISDIKNKKTKETSLGQQQRTALIRALIQPFETILMDEPFSHLDSQNISIATNEILKACKQQNANFILTSLSKQTPFDNVSTVQI